MRKFGVLLVSLLVLLVAGCGGGGGGSSDNGGRSGNLSVFITDAFNDDYDHVWIRIHKVELLGDDGSAETLFESAEGLEFDLKTLRDQAGQRFALLTNARARSRRHTRIRVTVADTAVLFPTGATTGQTVQINDALPRDSANRPMIVFALAQPRNLGSGNDSIVIDFDLANFRLVAGRLIPALREGDKNGLQNPNRHERHPYNGTISGLAGTVPNQTFTLTRSNGETFLVQTSTNTVIYRTGAATNPALTNGARVQVRGYFDVTANRLVASQILIKNQNQADDEAEVRGLVSNVNATAGTFRVATTQVRNFLPTQTTVNVVTNSTTVFRSHRGLQLTAEDFFAALAAAGDDIVEVEGVYNAGTNTITAQKVKLEEREDDRRNEAEARGTATAINANAGTFVLNPLTEWEGFVPAGTTLNVVTTANTRFRGTDGRDTTRAAFFAALDNTTRVRVEGSYAGGVLTATQARLDRDGQGGDD